MLTANTYPDDTSGDGHRRTSFLANRYWIITMMLMTFCVHRCGSSGLQRTLCSSAVRLQDTAESITSSAKTSKHFRSVNATHALYTSVYVQNDSELNCF